MTTLRAYIEGVGVRGPGIDTWPSAESVLTGKTTYISRPTVLPAPESLPPAERRRVGQVVRLALAIGLEATSKAGADPALLPSVFSSSGGDGNNCHEICQTLSTNDPQLSPTRFHNSVHNASAGYWSIATGAKAPSNALCAFDASFAAGLLEAMVQVAVDRTAVLLVAYDAPYPEPLFAKRPIPDAFGVAFVLTPQAGPAALAKLEASFADLPVDRMEDTQLEALRASIPAARSLPMLDRMARREPGRVTLEYLGAQRLAVEVTPCG